MRCNVYECINLRMPVTDAAAMSATETEGLDCCVCSIVQARKIHHPAVADAATDVVLDSVIGWIRD